MTVRPGDCAVGAEETRASRGHEARGVLPSGDCSVSGQVLTSRQEPGRGPGWRRVPGHVRLTSVRPEPRGRHSAESALPSASGEATGRDFAPATGLVNSVHPSGLGKKGAAITLGAATAARCDVAGATTSCSMRAERCPARAACSTCSTRTCYASAVSCTACKAVTCAR